MTDNMDEFEQDQFDGDVGMDGEPNKAQQGSFFDRLRSKPVFKLIVIVGVVGVAVAGALVCFPASPTCSSADRAASRSQGDGGWQRFAVLRRTEQDRDEQRVDEAIKQKGSALPTPVGQTTDMINLDDLNKKGSLGRIPRRD